MIDVNHAYGVAEAIRLGRGLEDVGWRLRWYEDRSRRSTSRATPKCAARSPRRSRAARRIHRVRFRHLFAARAVDIAQPDLCIAGGFTACRHIVALAHAHGVQVNRMSGPPRSASGVPAVHRSIPVANHSLSRATSC